MIVDERAEAVQVHTAVVDRKLAADENRLLHQTIQAVTKDIANLQFNTAIARMMEFTNFFTKQEERPRQAMQTLMLLLSPFAPHIAEELWQVLGHGDTLAYEPWPAFEPEQTKGDTIEIPVQVNGKLRSKIVVPADADRDAIINAAKNDPRIKELLAGIEPAKTIFVPVRLINFVI
jgi:leucyl-tRNA synthetase